MASGGNARGRPAGLGGLALAGAVLAALLAGDAPATGSVLFALTLAAALVAAGLHLAGIQGTRGAAAARDVPFFLALGLAGAAVWSAATGHDPAIGLVGTGLFLVAGWSVAPDRPEWPEAVAGAGLAVLALAHRLF